MSAGTLTILGMGPGDPELITLKAARILAAAPVIASFAKHDRPGHARTIAAPHIAPGARDMRFEYPFTTEIAADSAAYRASMTGFYNQAADAIASVLSAGTDIALLCEGDPFFYGSAMYLFDRLGTDHRCEIVPGVTGMSAAWTNARLPIAHGDDVLSILPGTLPEPDLTARLAASDAVVIMKVGRNLAKICRALTTAGLFERAIYVERAGMAGERIVRLCDLTTPTAPYFSMILVSGRQRAR